MEVAPPPTLAATRPDALPSSACASDCGAPTHAARSPRAHLAKQQQQQHQDQQQQQRAVGTSQAAGKPPKWRRSLLGCWQAPSVVVITSPEQQQQQQRKNGLSQPPAPAKHWRSLLKPKASSSSGGGSAAAAAAALGLVARQSSASRDSCGSCDDACVRVTIGSSGSAGAEPFDKQQHAAAEDSSASSMPATPRSPLPPAARAAALSRASLRAPSVASDVAQWHDAASVWGGSDLDVDADVDADGCIGGSSSSDGDDDTISGGLVPKADLATALARGAPFAAPLTAAMAAAAARCLGSERALLRAAPAAALAPPYVPHPPLFFAERKYSFVPVPKRTPFAGYWLNDTARATPHPQPIDLMLGVGSLALVAHKSIPGLWLRETPTTFTMCARALALPIGPFARYVETFAKDGSTATWPARRDVRVGRSCGQLYYTACGALVFRVTARGLFGGAPEYVVEDYSTLSPCGTQITTRQVCVHLASGRVAEQYLAGAHVGPDAPAGHF